MHFGKNKMIRIYTLLLALLAWWSMPGHAVIQGVTGTTFNLVTGTTNLYTPDGDTIHMWGYGIQGSAMQYPGPTLIVNEGDVVTVTLENTDISLMPVSILFPGQSNVTATGGAAGLLTQESTGPGSVVTYTFTASNPGTYTYYSGTRPGLQVEMGLVGALIVRPAAGANFAYNSPETEFDREYLQLITEVDPIVHQRVELGQIDQVDNTVSNSVLWFINGRNAPDTLFPDNVAWMPNQPYSALLRAHPGDRVLVRMINGGREAHPYHTHGNHFSLIARDGRMLSSPGSSDPDLAVLDYTQTMLPGATYDGIFDWTGEKLGWDIYGTAADGRPHTCVDSDGDGFDDGDPSIPRAATREYCPDHEKPLPVIIPENQELAFGGFYGGSPFLGSLASLPPGEGGLNLNGGMFFMWHSHAERELTNNDIYPGGMLTMMIIEHPDVPIP
jgi:plastocyanin